VLYCLAKLPNNIGAADFDTIHWTNSVRKLATGELGGFNPSFVHLEDREFGIRLLASGHETHFLAEPLFIYHHGGSRLQLSLEWRKMLRAELKIVKIHANLARQEFGPLGALRMKAHSFKERGLWRGGLEGRAAWAWGQLLEAVSRGLPRTAKVPRLPIPTMPLTQTLSTALLPMPDPSGTAPFSECDCASKHSELSPISASQPPQHGLASHHDY